MYEDEQYGTKSLMFISLLTCGIQIYENSTDDIMYYSIPEHIEDYQGKYDIKQYAKSSEDVLKLIFPDVKKFEYKVRTGETWTKNDKDKIVDKYKEFMNGEFRTNR